jgi:hypothetical protein
VLVSSTKARTVNAMQMFTGKNSRSSFFDDVRNVSIDECRSSAAVLVEENSIGLASAGYREGNARHPSKPRSMRLAAEPALSVTETRRCRDLSPEHAGTPHRSLDLVDHVLGSCVRRMRAHQHRRVVKDSISRVARCA